MTIEVYRSLSGLGTRVTGQPVRSYVPWVDSDGTYCLQVGDLCNTGGAIKYTVAYDAAEEEATLSVDHDAPGTETGTATALVLDTETTLYAGDYWLKVTRVSDGLSGNLVVRPLLVQNNDIAQSDQSDPSSAITYRCVFLYNATGATATINTVTCAGGVEVSVGATASETTVTIADENTAPTGPSFSATPSPALSLAAGGFVPMWIARTVDETAGEHAPTIEITYNTTESIVLSGSYVTIDTSIPAYYLYKGYDERGDGTTIDNTTVDNRDDVAALPFTLDVGAIQDVLHGLVGVDEFTLRVGLRAATTAGVESQNQLLDYALTLNYYTGDITTPPAPVIDTVEYLDGGHVRLVVDHSQASGMTRATKLVATCNGSGSTETITRNLSRSEDTTETEIIFQTPVVWGASCTVTAKTLDADNHESAEDSDTQTAIFEYGADVAMFAPAPSVAATPQYTDEYTTDTWGDVDVITAPGLTEITVNGTAIFTARSNPISRNKLTTLALTGGTITGGTYADVIEPVSTTVFYFCAGGSRVAKVDTSAGTLTCPVFNDTAVYDCPVEGPYKAQGNTVYWQYFDVAANRWKPFLVVDLDNTAIHFVQNLECI